MYNVHHFYLLDNLDKTAVTSDDIKIRVVLIIPKVSTLFILFGYLLADGGKQRRADEYSMK